MAKSWDQWKRELLKLAKKKKKAHLLPEDNTLYSFWEQGKTPEEIIAHLFK